MEKTLAKNKKASYLTLFYVALSAVTTAQTTYLPINAVDYNLLDKLETRSGYLDAKLFLADKPTSRQDAINFLVEQRRNARFNNLSRVDRDNIRRMESISGEWMPDGDGAIDSKTPIFRTFYKKQPDFIHVKTDDFFLAANPIVGVQLGYENNGNNPLYINSKGVELRGRITDKLGFYTWFTDNQEKPVSYIASWANAHQGLPGADYYQAPAANKYDYLLAGGYFDFAAVKDHINITFGYDRHFIGDGVRSLVISDFSTGSPFLRISSRLGKFRYQNLFLELVSPYTRTGDRVLPKKYAAIHHLSVNATKWLNVGIFETTMFSTRDFDIGYLNPIIFYRSIEYASGSNTNVNVGFNFKAIMLKHIQLYGQFLLNEGNGNRFGLQGGAKYFDVAGIRNLDLQGEINLVRPYTYAAKDSSASYTQYNQPLAHPLGANFVEFIGIVRAQPVNHLYASAKGMYYIQGVDSAISNYGSNIFRSTEITTPDAGGIINGPNGKCFLVNINLSYELKPNLFIDAGTIYRRYLNPNGLPFAASGFLYAGIRLNFIRRGYDIL
ncbi:MAG: hypothetical protein JSS82_17420 [Bacteroidetes bacterium]|nr:hypothetical protein [Bacteroidota bacterium]